MRTPHLPDDKPTFFLFIEHDLDLEEIIKSDRDFVFNNNDDSI